MAKAGGIFGDLFGKKDKDNEDAVATAKAKQKAEAEERAKAAAKGQGKKDDGRIPNKPKQEKQMGPKFVSPNLTLDGTWGAATTKAVQVALGQPQTGEAWINNADAKVLQSKLGVAADGLFGPASNSALQKYLGVTADGVFGPKSVKALQEALNAGTFFPAK